MHGVRIAGLGRYAPSGILTNRDLEQLVDTTDEWIVQRTGMKRRHIAAPDQATSDLALPAALAALDAAGKSPSDLDLIIVATATPDYLFPATACILAARLGVAGKPAFDLSIACSGFVYACATAASLIRGGLYRTILVIGAETLSKIVDYTDRSTCVLFGDGAGAAVLERSAQDDFLGASLGSDGSDPTILYQPGGGSRMPYASMNGEFRAKKLGVIHMQGQSVFKVAVTQMAASCVSALAQAGLTPDDVDFIVPHQANLRIIDATVKMLKIPPEKCLINIQEYGNTSSASIPMALAEAVEAGRIKPGNVVVIVAFGGGLSWGAAVWRWSGARVGKIPAEFQQPEHAAAHVGR
ncbi:MAG TPA: beta-ketoacyl-ACP synthase III [Candidatus Eremiobacteraceae bacterium]|nr:beta-ketoacyl-ACP synthase III [Candidatus Eremiobacteraceae bacterium]